MWLAPSAVGTLRVVKIVWRKTFWHDPPFEREFKGIQKFEPISRSWPQLGNMCYGTGRLEQGLHPA